MADSTKRLSLQKAARLLNRTQDTVSALPTAAKNIISIFADLQAGRIQRQKADDLIRRLRATVPIPQQAVIKELLKTLEKEIN